MVVVNYEGQFDFLDSPYKEILFVSNISLSARDGTCRDVWRHRFFNKFEKFSMLKAQKTGLLEFLGKKEGYSGPTIWKRRRTESTRTPILLKITFLVSVQEIRNHRQHSEFAKEDQGETLKQKLEHRKVEKMLSIVKTVCQGEKDVCQRSKCWKNTHVGQFIPILSRYAPRSSVKPRQRWRDQVKWQSFLFWSASNKSSFNAFLYILLLRSILEKTEILSNLARIISCTR